MIRFEQVSVRYGDRDAVSALDLAVAEGELVALVGESGSGKSTTLRLVNRMVEPSAGRVLVGERDVAERDPVELRRGIGYVLQGIGLFPHRSVAENVATVPRLLGWPEAEVRARVDELLALVGLADGFADRAPASLSGGQQQRVGIARALAGRPRILLMDEPFGALDPLTREALRAELRALHRRLGLTSLLVTHDMAEALRLADRVAVLLEGRLVAVAPPRRLLRDPGHAYVEQLVSAPLREAAAIAALEGG